VADGVPEAIDGGFGGLAQQRLQLGKGVLDGIEVTAVGRKVEQTRSCCCDGLAHRRAFVAGQIVHHHDVAGAEFGHQHLLHIGLEGETIDRPVEDHRRHHAGDPQPGQEGCRLPMTVRNAGPEPLASWSAATTPGHVGRCPGLVDEHQTIRIEIELSIEPVPAPLQDVRAVLLGRVRGLFLNVRPQRSRKIQSVARAAYTSRSAASLSSISLMVMSGVVSTSPRM
jgi:hypothetical protein